MQRLDRNIPRWLVVHLDHNIPRWVVMLYPLKQRLDMTAKLSLKTHDKAHGQCRQRKVLRYGVVRLSLQT